MENRVKPFEHIRNFRDFGVIRLDGKLVRTNVLFRSAHFGEASEADIAALSTITIKADLRAGSDGPERTVIAGGG